MHITLNNSIVTVGAVDSLATPKSMRDLLGIKDPNTLGNNGDEAQKQREKTAYDHQDVILLPKCAD